ncbi:MAG TPA: FeoB-associated Cys-rich membrane protein [Candidatus Egerieisoma faecipullorum]|jgi:hypothetical protein|uniref:FeoB-associated Cys-rich membrane protein n=1 Tax=Candidatus Egerieisoma faecipullorum TaxID=2840963 RepID=A0A9D1I8M8_9CLOT|nr:FeoB-associated Cys-rich membrane protein [Candidatus Egerieisoma faecipullorum]
MKVIPYLLAAAALAWGAYSLIKHFKNRKKQDCGGCHGDCDRCEK